MKARIKQNVWGNWNGYLGTKRVIEFGNSTEFSAEQNAQIWLAREQGHPIDESVTCETLAQALSRIVKEQS